MIYETISFSVTAERWDGRDVTKDAIRAMAPGATFLHDHADGSVRVKVGHDEWKLPLGAWLVLQRGKLFRVSSADFVRRYRKPEAA